MENKNELTVFEKQTNNAYCSKALNTIEEKKDLYNALEKCDVLLNDCVGQEIHIKDIYVEQREVADEETGELKQKFRTIIFDENGQTYATGSYGVYNALLKITRIYGLPHTWEEPVIVEVAKRPIGKGKSSLTLTIK